jgi:hypothetical protein
VLLTIARYFSVRVEHPVATHTAIHTIQLHTIPRKNVVMNGCSVAVVAVCHVYSSIA